MYKLFLLSIISIFSFKINAQQIQVNFKSEKNNEPINNVTVAKGKKIIGFANNSGSIQIKLNNGIYNLIATAIGYKEKNFSINVPDDKTIDVIMEKATKKEEEVTIVASTRTNQKIENSPLKVEVLGREEMDEENTIKPAGIASILGDVSGVQIQQSSAVNANSNVRIQGLDGRYTQILKDGIPLYDGFSGGFGILSIPPLDLKQVELIKGSASTLFGGGAIGGLVNIISRKPTTNQEMVFTTNYSSLTEANFNTFLSKKYKKIGYTFFAGYTTQQAQDVNKDLLSDVPLQHILVLHPRLFFYITKNTTITLGHTITGETRVGGDMQLIKNQNNADAVHQFYEKNKSWRNSTELVIEHKLKKDARLDFKNNFSAFDREIQTNTFLFRGNQYNFFSELSYYKPYKQNSFVTGINFISDQFNKTGGGTIPLQNFGNTIIGLFAQNTWKISDKAIVEAGLRNDYTNHYGNFILPRAALIYHINDHWASRAGIGFGYKLPNALSAQIKDFSIQSILPMPNNIIAEKSIGYNAEINYKTKWEDNTFFINHAFFLTSINNPIIATEMPNGYVSFSNANKPIVSKGFDTYIRTTISEWEFYAGYTYTIAERKYLTTNQFVPLTPKNRMAFTIVHDWEEEGWRIGLEGSYNGYQYRENYTKTPSYFFAAAMIEKKLKNHFSIVLNGENLLNYKQSNSEALYTGTLANPTFASLWLPIDGRVINLSVKWKL